jgi:hypothetical protein
VWARRSGGRAQLSGVGHTRRTDRGYFEDMWESDSRARDAPKKLATTAPPRVGAELAPARPCRHAGPPARRRQGSGRAGGRGGAPELIPAVMSSVARENHVGDGRFHHTLPLHDKGTGSTRSDGRSTETALWREIHKRAAMLAGARAVAKARRERWGMVPPGRMSYETVT